MPFADPDHARNYQREYRRLSRAGDSTTTPCKTQLPLEFRLRRAAEVLDMLEEQIAAVVNDPEASALEKARCVGYLAGVTLRAIEAGNVTARLEAVEAVLKDRASKEVKP